MPDLSGILNGIGPILQLFVAFIGAYLFAVTVSMIIWTYRDIRSRSRDIFAQVLAVLLVVVFNVAGLLLYFILRPRETLAEKYERELAEEALLQDIEERQVCPVCHHKITSEYLVCPNCHTKLHKKCENCGRVLNLRWNVCPYCGVSQSVPTPPRVVSETPLSSRRDRRREPTKPEPEPVASKPIAVKAPPTEPIAVEPIPDGALLAEPIPTTTAVVAQPSDGSQ